MAQSTFWWLLAGAMVALELLTTTFYLLVIGIGLAAGAVAAHAGMSSTWQMTLAAIVAAAGILVIWLYKKRLPATLPASSNPDVNMDVGETVQVDAWAPDGTASVKYRGAQWTVVSRPGNVHTPGPHRVAEVIGNRLLVDRI